MTDPLAERWRPEFPIVDTCTYLVSHSLGAMPRRAVDNVQAFAESWMTRGVRAWSEGWWEMGRTVGDILAPVVGAPPGSISMHQNASVAQGIIGSCFRYDGPRRKIVMSSLEFPTNIYLFEGFRRYGAEIVLVEAADGIRSDLQQLLDAIDETTVLVPLSLVLFRSSFIQDARAVIEKAQRVGAYVILDIYQAAGVIPIDLTELEADFAVGGSVKWLCGGPGAGYLYVRPDLARTLEPAFVGWAAHVDPFAFEAAAIRYADPPERFQSGTPNVPALYAARAGYEIVGEIGVEAIRRKSLAPDAAPDRSSGRLRFQDQHATGGRRACGGGDCRRAGRIRRHSRAHPPRGDRRLPAGRRHPLLAALLQHGCGDRSRHGCAGGDCGGSRVMHRATVGLVLREARRLPAGGCQRPFAFVPQPLQGAEKRAGGFVTNHLAAPRIRNHVARGLAKGALFYHARPSPV